MGSSPVTPTTNFAECIHCVHSVFLYPFDLRLRIRQNGYKNEHALRAEVCAVELAIAYVPRSKGTKVVPSFLNCVTHEVSTTNFAEHALRAEVCAVELAIAYVPRNYKRSTSFVEDMRN